nr:probable RNA-dependent RNA polymerase 1 [Ipomoea batatas]
MGKTIQVFGFPELVSADASKQCLEEHTGKETIFALQMKMTKGTNAKPFAIVQFKTEESADQILDLANNRHKTLYYGESLLTAKKVETPIVEPRIYAHEIDTTPVCFGCQISEDRFCVLWRKVNVGVKFGIGFKYVSLFLFYDNDQYKFLLSYEDIWRVTQHFPRGKNSKFLVIQLFAAPRIYKKTEPEDSVNTFYLEAPEDQWVRTRDFTQNCTIGQSTALCLQLPSNAYLPNFHHSFANYSETKTPFYLDDGSSFSSNSSLVPIVNPPSRLDLPFKIVFKICSLVQHGCIPGPALDEKFFQLLDPKRFEVERIEYALEKMQRLKDCCYDPAKLLTQEYNRFKQQRKKPARSMDEGIAYVRRVSVTPIRVYFFGPEANMSNRVLRQFREDIDRFLRVSFVDEDLEKMHSVDLCSRPSSAGDVSRTEIYKRILTTLENGIVIGDRKFEFLAFSSSQLRENSCWMFASRSGLTAADIRAWMGDFQNIKNVAKYAARLGQSFGSSRETSSVESYDLELIPDVELQKDDGTKYTFSDGIGKISAEFAKKVAEKCGLKKPPSAYQIRYGGYKGVVAVDPTSTRKLSLRKSMLKYESGNTKLDVLSWSKYQPCYLNRQIITLLSTLGISDEVFERKQREVVSQLDDMLTDPNKAQEFLELMPPGEHANVLIEMLRCGYKPNVEPFLSSMLQTIRGTKLQELRTKTRIFIPDGRSMMGCLDETGTLDYGEVFIQYSGAGRRHPHLTGVSRYNSDGIILGPVVVAKNPCYHPGDVRVLKGVDVRALHHMVDCIVFPQKGNRPHPNECSGSDLDGDIYFVCWDPDLIPKRIVSPMDYTPAPVIQLDHDVTIQEIQKYFADYILNDNLGVISIAHVVFADREPDMALSEPCLELARIFSVAVDFPKTGVPAEIPSHLRVKEYPDFLDKPGKPFYESKRVIGKLFRQVKDISANWSFISPFTLSVAKKSYDRAMEVDGFKDYIQEAFDYKTRFDEKLVSLMDYYGIKTEAELLTGRVNDPAARLYDRRRDGEAVILAVKSLRKEARSWFYDHHPRGGAGRGETNELRKKQRASAWYHVTYHHSFWGKYREGRNHEHFISFPWCVYDVLIKIKMENPGSIWQSLNFTSFEWLCNIC